VQSGTVTRSYSYGLERIDETQTLNAAHTTSFYSYDGRGSVRQLSDSSGAVTDTYDYDAFGNLIKQTGSTPNNYLFAANPKVGGSNPLPATKPQTLSLQSLEAVCLYGE